MSADLLYKLVKSLDRNEKGYFKKQATLHGKRPSQNYLLLFDAIDRQKEYDEKSLRAQFAGSLKPSAFSQTKSYLLDNILKSLIAYYHGMYARDVVQGLLQSAIILFNKNLELEAGTYLTKAKALAYKIEDFQSVLTVIKWEKSILTLHFKDDFPKKIDGLLAEEQRCIEQITTLAELQHIYYRMFYFIKKERFVKDEQKQQEIERLIQSPVLTSNDYKTTVYGRITFNSIYLFYYDLTGDFEKGFEVSRENLDTWKQNPDLLRDNLARYLSAIQNLMNECWRLKRYDEILPLLDDLATLKPRNTEMKTRVFETYHLCEILYHATSFRIHEYLPKLEPFLKDLDRLKGRVRPNYYWLFLYNITGFCMFTDNWDKALVLLNRLFQGKDYEQFTGMKRVIFIINLIIHYELENVEILPYYIKSTERFFRKMDYGKLELSFVDFMKKLVATPPSEKKELFRRYLHEVDALEKEASGQDTILKIFEWRKWLLSKIKNKPILAVVLEDAN